MIAIFPPGLDNFLSEFHEELQKIANIPQILKKCRTNSAMPDIARNCADFICSFHLFNRILRTDEVRSLERQPAHQLRPGERGLQGLRPPRHGVCGYGGPFMPHRAIFSGSISFAILPKNSLTVAVTIRDEHIL
jgi:hypothetical protein